jgi:hypothetical protein
MSDVQKNVSDNRVSLSIGCFVHNLQSSGRGTTRVRNFLYSLRNQLKSNIQANIIIFNWSNDSSFNDIDDYCKEFNAIHIYKRFEGKIWNKSKSLNYSLKHYLSDYIMGTDIDYIFSPNFFQAVQSRLSRNRILLCGVHKLQPQDKDIIYSVENYKKILQRSVYYKNKEADGASQIVSGEWFIEHRGYHEGIELWGGMDNEFSQLSRLWGLEQLWIDDKTTIIHQFHPDDKLDKSKSYYEFAHRVRQENIKILRRKDKNRNSDDWGQIEIDNINDWRNGGR